MKIILVAGAVCVLARDATAKRPQRESTLIATIPADPRMKARTVAEGIPDHLIFHEARRERTSAHRHDSHSAARMDPGKKLSRAKRRPASDQKSAELASDGQTTESTNATTKQRAHEVTEQQTLEMAEQQTQESAEQQTQPTQNPPEQPTRTRRNQGAFPVRRVQSSSADAVEWSLLVTVLLLAPLALVAL